MPDNNQNTNQDNEQNEQNTNTNKQIVLGCDSNGNNKACQDTVAQILERSGYKVEKLEIGPSPFASYSYGENGAQPKGKIGVYLMAGSLVSFVDAADAYFDYNVFGIRGDISEFGKENVFSREKVPPDHDGCGHPKCSEYGNKKSYPELNDIYKGKCIAVPGETHEELAQNIITALGGQYSGSGETVSSSGGAQIKDITFEECIRRICAATDSVFLVENNAAVLFPYTDWLAFTLRQKISTISTKEIDPNIFTTEYNNDGFYNKVTVSWGNTEPSDRFSNKEESQKTVLSDNVFTSQKTVNLFNNVRQTLFNNKKSNDNTTVIKKGNTTQEISTDETGTSLVSEQYDSLVEKYGVLEKKVKSKVSDLETAQYIASALLIQYVRDFNNECRCRALTNRKYNGGSFYIVVNPFTHKTELQFLNGYNMAMQKKEPLYYDLEFRYGPESVEEILDYQKFSGGGSGSTSQSAGDGSATEQQIWADAAKIHYANGDTCSSDNPKEAYDTLQPNLGKAECKADCYGMSSYLYYRFNYQAGIPCRIIEGSGSGSSGTHRVVMILRNNQWYRPVNEYQKLEGNFRYNSSCKTTNNIHKKEPNAGASDNTNTIGGNTGG